MKVIVKKGKVLKKTTFLLLGFSLFFLSGCTERESTKENIEVENNLKNILVRENLMWQDDDSENKKPIWNAKIKKDSSKTWDESVQFCKSLSLGNYTDWKVPSKEMLAKFYKEQASLGSLSRNSYWTSSEIDKNHVWIIRLPHIDKYGAKKNKKFYVRCVREVSKSVAK